MTHQYYELKERHDGKGFPQQAKLTDEISQRSTIFHITKPSHHVIEILGQLS